MTTAITGLFEDVRPRTPSARRVAESDYRLDASYFSHGAEDARVSMTASPFTVSPLRTVADVFALSDFSLMRIPAIESRGVPFLTVSESFEWIPTPSMFLSKKYEPHLDDYIVKEGCILLSRSGTIGKTLIVGRELAGKAVANHAIRIVPKTPDLAALIYLILGGQAGQQVVAGYTYGSVVGEIKPTQIEQVLIPMPPPAVRAELRKKVDDVLAARADAFRLHEEAIRDVLAANALDDLSAEARRAAQNQNDPEIVLTSATRSIQEVAASMSECRLDAHFYNATAQRAVGNIKKCRSEVKSVRDLSRKVLMGPRFKRNYVDAARGVPFLSGRNIVETRPNLNYLSKIQMAGMQELLVTRGWTLITCSGTIGRTCFVWKNYEDYAASQHILRVIPDEAQIDPGYLYAFLSSRYGYEQILRYRHGSVIDEVTDTQIERVVVPRPSRKDQIAIGDKVRCAYEKRADAILCEDEAQAILMKELTKAPSTKGT